jgi:acetate kinase
MAHSIVKCIGAYTFAMGGLDTIIFTGGVGENSELMRTLVCKNLGNLGIILDPDANIKHNRTEHMISSAGSRVKIWIIPTNEELVIARNTYRLVKAF